MLLLLACTEPDPGAPADSDTATGADSDTDSGTGTDTGTDTPPLADFALAVDADVVTLVHATWTGGGVEDTWVEYRFETDEWLTAPTLDVGTAVLLGIPALTAVEARVVQEVEGKQVRLDSATVTTGALPEQLLQPTIDAWDPELADAAPYVMISIDCGDYTFQGPYWIQIFDRQGRVVWYRRLAYYMTSFYPSVAFDGSHIWFDASDVFHLGSDTPHVERRTLDARWSERIDMPDMGQAVGEGPDGTFFYERRSGKDSALMSIDGTGVSTTVWDCAAWMATAGGALTDCYMNTTNWSETHNTVLTSMFYSDTVFEIELDSGEPLRQMGQLELGAPYEFSPASSMFAYQHHPHWTTEGTLLVSTHEVGVSGVQYAAEYSVDDETDTLTRIWFYQSTDTWATQLGEAIRLRNGNTVQGYGQDGAVREVTPEGTTAWQVSWEKDLSGYRIIGHVSFIDDLYALNRGPE